MPVSSVTRMWSRFGSTLARADKKLSRTIRDAYQIVHDPDDSRFDIEQANGVPQIGSLYPGSLYVFCDSVELSRVSPIMTIASITYKGEIGPNGEEDSPLNAPPEISWSDTETDEPTDEDINGKPIVNVNGEPIDGVTMKIADNIVTIKRNFLTFNPYVTGLYRHSVSSDTFLGYPAGTARLIRYSAKNSFYNDNQSYWEVTGSIQFRLGIRTTDEKAWYKRVRNEGYYEKIVDPFSSSEIIVQATDANGKPVTRPVLLKEDGTRETNPDNAHWLEFQVYRSLPYNALGLI
jgi:hypothetical protein